MSTVLIVLGGVWILLSLVTELSSGQVITGSYIVCQTNQACSDDTITCDSGADCTVVCDAQSSGMANQCTGATINCPDNYACDIQCGGTQSCSQTTINGNNASSLTIATTTEGGGQLYESTINCPHNIDANCSVECDNQNQQCQGLTINAEQSNHLFFSCVQTSVNQANQVCTDANLYCPANDILDTSCYVTGAAGSHSSNIAIYSLYGWQSVIIDGLQSIGTIFCGNAYQLSCSINTDGECWNSVCDDPVITTTTTTTEPTNDPTTDPTTDPTANPTLYPTADPTIDPTTVPTLYPTVYPTISPTTNRPTSDNIKITLPDGKTPSPTSDNEGSMDATDILSTLQIRNDIKGNGANNDYAVTYYLIAAIVVICCILCAVFMVLLRNKKKKKQMQDNKVSNVDNISIEVPASANTTNSASPPLNALTSPKQFKNNLSALAVVNNLLMNDVVNEMNVIPANTPTPSGDDDTFNETMNDFGEILQSAETTQPSHQNESSASHDSNENDDYKDDMDINMAGVTPNGDCEDVINIDMNGITANGENTNGKIDEYCNENIEPDEFVIGGNTNQ